ncbi:MAG: DUF975 family protein [Treponema sp.]|jgi:hypothetical protein|nr:DUF975 family protein [Treponema sp.]
MFKIWQLKTDARTQLRGHRFIPVLLTLITLFLYFLPLPPQMTRVSEESHEWKFHYDNDFNFFDFPDFFDFLYDFDTLKNVVSSFFYPERAILSGVIELLTFLLFSSILIGLCRYYLLFSIDSAKTSFGSFLEGLNGWYRGILARLYVAVRLLLWGLLFMGVLVIDIFIGIRLSEVPYFNLVIPGLIFLTVIFFTVFIIYKCIAYSQIYFVLAEYPAVSIHKALKTSIAITRHQCGRLFLLALSFIGWAFLCLFTLGIGFLFLIPYISVSFANAYKVLKQQSFEKGILVKIPSPAMGQGASV